MMERESVLQGRRAGCRGRKRRAADKAAFDVSVGRAVCRVNAQCWRVEELDGMLVMDKRARGRDARDQRGSCRVLSDLESIEVEVTSWKLGKVLMAGPRVKKAHSTFQPRINATSTPTPSTNQHLIKTLMSLLVRLWYTAVQASPPTPPSSRIFAANSTCSSHATPRLRVAAPVHCADFIITAMHKLTRVE
jgi:hypothetical protein